MLPSVDQTRILKVGCSAGELTEELEERGATVVGLDGSRKMPTYARNRVPDADLVQTDLGDGVPFDAETFDGVISSLAVHYVRDWDQLLCELRRVLDVGGWVDFSVQHP
ncbi:class I SAM-dependent methyltransferase [Haloprofundus salinisoli]|uniref:class I SAM-dependent methyltransferase n=1 Tax=Haloprofundus salinisoli TaxID=2876193 RepID=UPI003CE5A5F2